MNFWQQLRDAVRGQNEDFFRVKWQVVVLLLIIIAGFIDLAYLRFTYGPRGWNRAPYWSAHEILGVGVSLAFLNLKRFLG